MCKEKRGRNMAVSMAIVKNIKGEGAKKILASSQKNVNTGDLMKKCSAILKKS